MNIPSIHLAGADLVPLPSGALWWPDARLLCVSDLHLGKAERMARRGGGLLPPYEGEDTLARLDAEVEARQPEVVVCLGDSFDDSAASDSLPELQRLWLARLMAGRDWIWIEGNHDPGPLALGGQHRADYTTGPLTFRHIARADAGPGEISGHYHPKARLRGIRRPCFLTDGARLILPAFGTYTGGMDITEPALRALMARPARAILTGPTSVAVPLV
jgi:DNA ligase-associated metallophosphoesterase